MPETPVATTPLETAEAGPRLESLRKARDFDQAFRRGRRSRQRLLAMVARPNDLEATRVGFAISRRVGGAVVRNRVRRRLKALLRELPIAQPTDLVLTAQPAAAEATFADLRRDLEACAQACGLLEPDELDSGAGPRKGRRSR
ncbi:MAG: ribonuclease P protein component [Dehalococcoidia bacterium]